MRPCVTSVPVAHKPFVQDETQTRHEHMILLFEIDLTWFLSQGLGFIYPVPHILFLLWVLWFWIESPVPNLYYRSGHPFSWARQYLMPGSAFHRYGPFRSAERQKLIRALVCATRNVLALRLEVRSPVKAWLQTGAGDSEIKIKLFSISKNYCLFRFFKLTSPVRWNGDELCWGATHQGITEPMVISGKGWELQFFPLLFSGYYGIIIVMPEKT